MLFDSFLKRVLKCISWISREKMHATRPSGSVSPMNLNNSKIAPLAKRSYQCFLQASTQNKRISLCSRNKKMKEIKGF